MGKKMPKQDLNLFNWRKSREFGVKKESFDFEWVADSALDRKRKGKSVDGAETSQKKSKFDFDAGFIMLSESEDECCPRHDMIPPHLVKSGLPPKRGRGRPRKNKRDERERIMNSDEDVVVIDFDDEVDAVVNNVGENEIDSGVFGESGVRAESRTGGGSENSVVNKKSVSVGVQVEDDVNLAVKKCVSVGVQVSEDDWKNDSSNHMGSPCLGDDGRVAQCDHSKCDVRGDATGLNVDAKLGNSNPLDMEQGVISEDDAAVFSGDIEYVAETSGSYISMDDVGPCESEDEDSKFRKTTSIKDEGCSEQNTASLNCVAKRTRSHFTKPVDRKLGTFSQPVCLGDDSDDVSLMGSSGDDGVFDNSHHRNKKSSRKKPKTDQKRHNQDCAVNVKEEDHDHDEDCAHESQEDDGDHAHKSQEDDGDHAHKSQEDDGDRAHKSEEDDEDARFTGKAFEGAAPLSDRNPIIRKQVRSPKSYDGAKILIDSMLENKEIPVKEEMIAPAKSIHLPTKFWYHTEEPKPPEKSEYEKEMDKLWNEMEYCKALTDIGSAEPDLVEQESSDVCRDAFCACGRDGLILDDEVGLKCKYCSYVHHEIREIAPEFDTYPFGKGEWRASLGGDDYFFKGFSCSDSVSSPQDHGPSPDSCGTVWDLIPGIRSTMYPHQREGFEFIWRNIAGSTELGQLAKQTRPDGGSGCIISHAPGTGKTRLTIVFLQTFMKLFPMCRPVIIAPRSMLLTWEEEFQKWKVDIPFHNLNKPEFSGKEREKALQLRLGDNSPRWMRLVKLFSWCKKESVLGISYPLFEKLAGQGRKMKKHHELDENIRKILLEFPGLLILDEGHTPRNDQSLIWKVLCEVQTQRRIILSGTPFQNNFEELLNTLYLVRPKILETITSGPHCMKRRRKGNLLREKWATLTNSIGENNYALQKLREMIDPFVHVHKGTILQESLPGLRDSVVILQLGDLQKTLLEDIKALKNPLGLSHLVSLISVHPSLFPEDFNEVENGVSISIDRRKLEKLKNEPEVGVKAKFLIELIRLSEALKEKVLVFSQFIDPLTLLMEQLSSSFKWTEGKEILYMDGQRDIKQRQMSINTFNSPMSEARVLLASLKACSEGINLVGASRVVLLDVVWNPSVERQAISRAYRLGQKNIVHVYHLIASETYEEEKYCRQLEKDRLSELVFSSSDGIRKGKGKVPILSSEDQILREMAEHPKLNHMFERIIEQPKERNLIDCYDLIDLTDPQT